MADFFPGKLLLFGEYTVLHGSQALAVPLKSHSGNWINRKSDPDETSFAYFEWLKQEDLIDDRILKAINSDHQAGWRYESNIPQGYGLGSSGAYVAAIYDRYFPKSDDLKNITTLLAKMESFFHGSSSGMDPLVSYSGRSVYKDQTGNFHALEDKGWPDGYHVYLLDSGQTRETSVMVESYKSRLLDEDFKRKVQHELVPFTEHAIHFYLMQESKMLEECIHLISMFQRKYFQDMIPEGVNTLWDELSVLPGVYVKLCGAGGGGYFLVIATEQNTVMNDYPLIKI